MSQYVLTREDMEPLLEGLAVFGTGGGGSPLFGKAIMENDFKKGRKYISLLSLGLLGGVLKLTINPSLKFTSKAIYL